MINIVVPMAGRGERFWQAGYRSPKPLIDVGGKPMISWVIDDILRFIGDVDHRFIFIILQEHVAEFGLDKILYDLVADCVIVVLSEVTKGAVCTVLKAEGLITGDPLIITNSDQHFEGGCLDGLKDFDGALLTFSSSNPMCSFVRVEDGVVVEVQEKKVISDRANVGVYYFRDGRDFLNAAWEMISVGDVIMGEFYVAPVYNFLISKGLNIGYLDVKMSGLGTPQDLESFIAELGRDGF